MKDCLLIIDVQIGFLTKETMHIPDRIVCLAEKNEVWTCCCNKVYQFGKHPSLSITHD